MHHFQCMYNSTDLFQTHCCGQCPASSSRLWKVGCPSNVAHESKLQKASVDPAVISGLWKKIQDQNCSGFGSESERPETPADHSPFHCDRKLLQNKHTIYHQQLNQSSINQWSEIRPSESRRHWLHHLLHVFDCVWKSWDVSVDLLQLLLHHLLLLLLFLSQCSDCSFFFISEKLMKLLKLLVNLTLCVLSLRLKSNHIQFNRLKDATYSGAAWRVRE